MLAAKKKLFILFSGEMRFFHENILSINESLNEYDKTFLFYPWNHQSEVIKKFMKYYTKNHINYITENNWEKIIEKIKYPDNAASIPGLFFMWDALTQSFSKLKYELNDNDLILRFRSDIKINSKKLYLNLDNVKNNTLYIPDCYHWNGYNDQVFLSKVKTLSKFSNFFEFLNKSIEKNHFICPEYIFHKFLKKEKINTIFFEFDYQILKNKKIAENKDMLVKEKKSYIPIKDKITIKILKILYKFRNFKEFYLKKKKRNKNQNLFYD